jgi:hypothetical protein
MQTLIENIQKALDAAGLRWSDLSTKSGICGPDIYRFRAGKHKIRIDRAELMARSIGYDLWQLLKPEFKPRRAKRQPSKNV